MDGQEAKTKSFPTTNWSLVLRLQSQDASGKSKALDVICQDYWQPLFRQVKAWTRSNGDHPTLGAEDLTQSFFAQLSQGQLLKVADREKGRLRSLLSVSLNRFFQNELSKTKTQRRGGDKIKVAIPVDQLPEDPNSHPDTLFDLDWARNIMALARSQLEEYYKLRGRSDYFRHLWPLIEHTGQSTAFEKAAEALGTERKRVAVEIFRLRQRYRQYLLEQVARTVGTEDDVRDEFNYLKQLITGHPGGQVT